MDECDFLVSKPIQYGADLSNEWLRFIDAFQLHLTATEKEVAVQGVKIENAVCHHPKARRADD